MAMKLALGIIAVNQIILVVIRKDSIIHGKWSNQIFYFVLRKQNSIFTRWNFNCVFCKFFQINFRCFVGDGTDQWRTCSDRYYPLSSSGSSQIAVTTTSSNNKKKTSAISYTPNKRKGDQYHQQPPRPGGLQNLEDIASARLWPVTYLYSSGPPNSTELSNFVDCNKENC